MTDQVRLCDTEAIEQMVRVVDPDWTVLRDVPISSGRHWLHRLHLNTPSGTCKCVLKATTDSWDYCKEARLLSILAQHTNLPVPTVLGAVDTHDTLPAPFFLMEALPGESVHKTETNELSTECLRGIATSSGVYLAQLHQFDAVDAYGGINVERGPLLTGGVPAGNREGVSVSDGCQSWPVHLEDMFDGILDALSDSLFEDVLPEIEPAGKTLLAGVATDGPYVPVVGRVENSLDNLLVDLDTNEVTGLLDWEFITAMTAANDLVLAEFWLSGGPWSLIPSNPDPRDTVRAGLIAGYGRASQVSDRVLDEFRTHHDLYALLSYLRVMQLFEGMFAPLPVTAEEREAAQQELRTRVRTITQRVEE